MSKTMLFARGERQITLPAATPLATKGNNWRLFPIFASI
jgi:hypothetical protein